VHLVDFHYKNIHTHMYTHTHTHTHTHRKLLKLFKNVEDELRVQL